jgi:Rv0623-like transcription factor
MTTRRRSCVQDPAARRRQSARGVEFTPMGLNIKNDEAQRLSRELAAVTGETITGAIATVRSAT